MDPKQVSPQVGVNSGSVGSSATGSPVFANPANNFRGAGAGNRFQDTNSKGDIIIPPSDGSSGDSAKSPLNKKLVIGIIAGVVVLVVAIILVIVFTGGNKSGKPGGSGSTSGSSVVEDASVAEKFNKYANFIITGEASPNRIPREDELTQQVIRKKIADHDEDFMDEAEGYLDDFYNALTESEDVSTGLINFVEYYRKLFEFFYKYSQITTFTNDDIVEMKSEEGTAATEAAINERYSSLAEMADSSLAKEYTEKKIAYDKAILNGEAPGSLGELSLKISNLLNEYENDLIFYCYDIDGFLYDENYVDPSVSDIEEEETE